MTARESAPFPWNDVMAAGLGVLQLAPEDFWRMTPRELAAALDGLAGRAFTALAPVELQALMRRYPD